MGEPKDEERDEELFKEVYGKEYTGPVRPTNENSWDNLSSKKRSASEANDGEPDVDDALPDPNAVPTDFTSREAKVWEAKAKAIERNWKKKKEEELICRICGEYGHFSQGCPTTLGANRKHSDIIEKVPVKDRRLKPRIIGTGGATIRGIEKDTGCRLKLEDNLAAGNGSFFVRIAGSSRLMVGKAVNAVKKLLDNVQHDWKPQGLYRSHGSQNHTEQVTYLSNPPSHHDPNMQLYPGQEVPYYGDGHRGSLEQINKIDGRRQWDNQNGSFPIRSYRGEDVAPDIDVTCDWQSVQTLEALEQKFVQETIRLTKELNDAEDKENTRHREAIREIQELYQQKMASLRTQQIKQREDFLRNESHFRKQQYQQYQQTSVQSGFKYYDYEMGPSSDCNDNRDSGYGSLVDRNDELAGGYCSFRSDGGYNTSHSFRSSGYDGAMHHLRNQDYDAGQYRY